MEISPLLELAQKSFPVTQFPFKELAKSIGKNESEALVEYAALKEAGVVRQTSAILEAKRLGYASSLVAFKVPEEKVETAAAFINAHPGVSHNYLRSDPYNIWFTLMTPPDSFLGLNKTIEGLAKRCGCEDFLILPTEKLFKIGVHLKAAADPLAKTEIKKTEIKPLTLTSEHTALLEWLQRDIPVQAEPFKPLIEALGIDYARLEMRFDELKAGGLIRRFATILNHRKAGFNANAMSVWQVPDDRIDEVGAAVAGYSAVSHCYKRTAFADRWPYNLYAMIHGKEASETNKLIEQIKKEHNLTNYKILYSTREFKKARVRYFSPEFSEWEKNFLQGGKGDSF